MSDLHTECYKDGGARLVESMPTGDVLILAGDITYLRFYSDCRWLLKAIGDRFNKIFFVPGNHEYWRSYPNDVQSMLLNFEFEVQGFHWLRTGNIVEYKGKRFMGDTMWFPDDPLNPLFAKWMPDFELIKDFVPWVYEENQKFKDFARAEMKEGDIVVTHHAPSTLSISDFYKDDDFNRFFVSPMEDVILDKKPALWIHGHMHQKFDYTLGDTRVVCNPFGYPREKNGNLKFKESIVVEI